MTALRKLFPSARRAFLFSPPTSPDTHADAGERANVDAIIAALEGSGLEKVVAASTYGARPGASGVETLRSSTSSSSA